MADYLNKFPLVQGQAQVVDKLDTFIAFDFLNNSPFDIDVIWGGQGRPVALSVPPGAVWRGAQPSQDLLIAGNKWGGRLTFTPELPLGSANPNLSPAQQLTLYGYVKGNEPPESVSNLNFQVSNVLQATNVKNDGNPPVVAVVEATPQGASSSELLWNNDGSGIYGGGINSVDNTGAETHKTPVGGGTQNLFIWDNTANAGGHKLILQLTAANELILLDFTANVILFKFVNATSYVANGLTTFPIAGGIVITSGNVSFDNGAFLSDGVGNVKAVSYITLHGNQETGYCGASFEVGGSVASAVGPTVNFKTVMTNVPSSITLNTPIENSGASSPGATDINKYGFWLAWTATTINSLSRYTNTYVTVGN